MYLDLLMRRITDDEKTIRDVANIQDEKEKLDYIQSIGFNLDEIMNRLEDYFGVDYADLDKIDGLSETIKLLNEDVFKLFKDTDLENKVVVYDFIPQEHTFYFATSEMNYRSVEEEVNEFLKKNGFNGSCHFAFDFQIKRLVDEMQAGKPAEEKPVKKERKQERSKEITIEDRDEFDAILWVHNTISQGIKNKASDVHIESKTKGMLVRYRIDGILTMEQSFIMSESNRDRVIIRVKTLSDMKIEEKRRGQDGRISNFVFDGKRYDLRVSSVATILGEKIVIRIIPKDERILSFEELGFAEKDIVKLKKALRNTNGIIYIGGATGSGKTTTLYTMIDYLDSPEKNIYTIENPVEREIASINQIDINEMAGVTFASSLRNLLRQDPDIMVVGEIRDEETANLSLNSSLAGHLILTTIHANNSLDTLNRLFELGLESYLVSATSLILMSQRLVRKLCPKCKEKAEPSGMERSYLEFVVKRHNLDIDLGKQSFYRAVGCSECNNGFKGRFAVGEIVEVTDNVRRLIGNDSGITEIEKVALEEGLVPFQVSGIKHILQGDTSIEEVMNNIN